MTRKIAFSNQKGGVGKTTGCVNVAVGLARLGEKVLVIDGDPKGNTTKHLGTNSNSVEKSLFELFRKSCRTEDILIPGQNGTGVDLLPSRKDLSAIELELINEVNREIILKNLLDDKILDDYGFIPVDTPPSLGMLTVNIPAFVEEVFIPVWKLTK